MKRHGGDNIGGSSKKPKTEPNYQVPEFLKEFERNQQLTLKKKNLEDSDKMFAYINEGNQKISPIVQELRDFIFAYDTQNQRPKTLHPDFTMELHDQPNKLSAGFYDMGSRKMNIFKPAGKAAANINPIITLIHEGTHALDDEHMRTYQEPTMSFLKKHLGATKIKDDKGEWYTGAQRILPNSEEFKRQYPFSNLKEGDDSLQRHYAQQLIDNQNDQNIQDEPTYIDLLNSLTIKGAETIKKGRTYSPMSEFPSFIIEGLDKSWTTQIPQNTNQPSSSSRSRRESPLDPIPNLGRKYLKKMTKATYQGFKKIDPDFNKKHPQTLEAFKQRIDDLRNLTKYRDKGAYLAKLDENNFWE